MNAQPSWDDLRVVLAVARHGSLSGAARFLGVNHSTVLRRIAALEAGLGTRLFDRLPSGYALTLAGDDMHMVAARMEEEIAAAQRRLSGRDTQPTGTVRVTTIDILALYLLPRHLASFRTAYPGISVELVIAETPFSLTKREADVAIRATNKPPEALVGRAVAGLAFAIYRARDSTGDATSSDDLAAHDWVALDESFDHLPLGRWVKGHVPKERIGYRANSVAALHEAAKAGLGYALLPCVLGDAAGELQRVTPPIPELATQIWLLTHSDLRYSGRVRAFLDYIANALGRDRDLFEGRQSLF